MAKCKGDMETFYGLAKGGIEPIGILFRLPRPVSCEMFNPGLQRMRLIVPLSTNFRSQAPSMCVCVRVHSCVYACACARMLWRRLLKRARARMSSELAGEPMPPAVIMQVLSISEDQLKQAQEAQKAPVASLEQFFEAM